MIKSFETPKFFILRKSISHPPVVLSAFGIIFKEPKVIRFTLAFSSKNFMVLVLIYGPMTHFEVLFIYGMK